MDNSTVKLETRIENRRRWMYRGILHLGLTAFLTASIAEAKPNPPQKLCVDGGNCVDSQAMRLGVNVHLWGAAQDEVDKTTAAAADAGLNILRWDVPWKAVEKAKGQLVIPENWDYVIDKARANGVESLLILDYGNVLYDGGDKPTSSSGIDAFARYAETIVRHFAGRVQYYQIWNEWNGVLGNTRKGSSQEYAALVKAVYPRIKAVDPKAIVVAGGFSSAAYDSLVDYGRERSLETFLETNDIASFCDAIAIHPYVVYKTGEMHTFSGFVKLITAVVERIREAPGFSQKPIVITELGWSTANDSKTGVSEAAQSDLVVRAMETAKKLGISMFLLYELRDQGLNSNETEKAFGLLRHDWSQKEIYRELGRQNGTP